MKENKEKELNRILSLIQPTDEMIRQVLSIAEKMAQKDGNKLNGYETWRKEAIKKQAEYIGKALKEIQIEQNILETDADKIGIYAICIETIGLNPVIFIGENQIYLGIWLSNQTFSKGKVKFEELDVDLYKSMEESLLPIDYVTYINTQDMNFEEGIELGKDAMQEFAYIIDIVARRKQKSSGIEEPASKFKYKQKTNWYFFKEDTPIAEIKQAIFEKEIPIVTGNAGQAKKQIMDIIMEEALEREKHVLLISENIENENFERKDSCVCKPIQHTYADFITYDALSEEEKEQIVPSVKSALTKYENLWNLTCKLRNQLQSLEPHLEESSEKEILQQMVVIAKIIKKCPVYQRSIEEILQKPQADSASLNEKLIDQLYQLSDLKYGKPRYNKKKEKIINKFLSNYEASEIYNLFRDLAEHTEETLDRLEDFEVFCNEDGTMYLSKVTAKVREEQATKISKFLKEVDDSLEEETEDVQKIVQKVIAKIVLGEKKELKELVEELTNVYAEYVQAQSELSQKILKNQDVFGNLHPNVLKKVLFEAWINKYENDLYKEKLFSQEMRKDKETAIQEGLSCEHMTLDEVKGYTFFNFPNYDMIVIENELQLSIYDALIPMSKAKCCVIFTNEKCNHGGIENE